MSHSAAPRTATVPRTRSSSGTTPEPTKAQALALDRSRNLAVTAGAGTGKTWVLTQRFLDLIEHSPEGIGPRHVLAVTFTRKAAQEMRVRISEGISERVRRAAGLDDHEDHARWTHHRRDLDHATITTIHGLSAEIVRRFGLEEGIDPDFDVPDQALQLEWVQDAVGHAIAAADESLRHDLAVWLAMRHPRSLHDVLEALLRHHKGFLERWERTLAAHPDAIALLERQVRHMLPFSPDGIDDLLRSVGQATRRLREHPLRPERNDAAERFIELGRRAAELVADQDTTFLERCRALHDVLDHVTSGAGTYYTQPHHAIGAKRVWTPLGGNDLALQAFHDVLTALRTAIEDPTRFPALPGPDEVTMLRQMRHIAVLAADARARYEATKRRRGALDEDDLQRIACALARRPHVAQALRRRYRYLLIDEFQDTDDVQWEIVRILAHHDPEATPEPPQPEVVFHPTAWQDAASFFGTTTSTIGRPSAERSAPDSSARPSDVTDAKRGDREDEGSEASAPEAAAAGRLSSDADPSADPELAPDRLFIVGDDKQSIYGFRGADVSVYQESRTAVRQANARHEAYDVPVVTRATAENHDEDDDDRTEEERLGLVTLDRNFRSLPRVVGFTNRLFEHVLVPEGPGGRFASFEARPVSLTPHRGSLGPPPTSTATQAAEDRARGSVTLVVTPHKALEDLDPDPTFAAAEIQRLDPMEYGFEQIAERIRDLVEGDDPWYVEDPEHKHPRPARYEDIAILFARSSPIPELTRALRAHRIPHAVAGGRGFWATQEVYDVHNLLAALVDDQDDIALVGLLRSPFLAWDDNSLVRLARLPSSGGRSRRWRGRLRGAAEMEADPAAVDAAAVSEDEDDATEAAAIREARHLWATRPSRPDGDHASALDTLRMMDGWRSRLRHEPVADVVEDILYQTGYVAALRNDDRHAQALHNLEKLLESIRRFQRTHGQHPRRILDHFRRILDSGFDEGEAEVPSGEVGGVRILTIHASKGLEFPIVVVPELDRRLPSGRFAKGFNGGRIDATGDTLLGTKTIDPKTGEERPGAVAGWLRAAERLEERAEFKRLFYVATTRARDHLILHGASPRLSAALDPAVKAKSPRPVPEASSWMEWLEGALDLDVDGYNARLEARAEGSGRSLSFGETEVFVDLAPPEPRRDRPVQVAPIKGTGSVAEVRPPSWSATVTRADGQGAKRGAPDWLRTDPVRVSPSALELWRRCPARFRYRVIDGIPEVRARTAERRREDHATLIGDLVHNALEEGADADHPIPVTVVRRAARRTRALGRDLEATLADVERHVQNALRATAAPDADPSKRGDETERVVLHEVAIDHHVGPSLRLRGRIDRLEGQRTPDPGTAAGTTSWRVVDYKTDDPGKDPGRHAQDMGYDLQVGAYASAFDGRDTEGALLYTKNGVAANGAAEEARQILRQVERTIRGEGDPDEDWPMRPDAAGCSGCGYFVRRGGACPGTMLGG